MEHAVAYFNVDEAVAGPVFNAGAVPSLRQFLREIATKCPRPPAERSLTSGSEAEEPAFAATPASANLQPADEGVPVGDLGSGSDYTPFLQHAGVPSTDIGSDGPFGVYHTVFDDYDWFVRFVDPTFAYTQQQARFFGLEILHMADADVLPYDYRIYAEEIRRYLDQAHSHAAGLGLNLDFSGALAADHSFAAAAQDARALQSQRACAG